MNNMSTNQGVGKADPILGVKLPLGSIENQIVRNLLWFPFFPLIIYEFVLKLYWFHYDFVIHPQFYPLGLEYFIVIL
jgi:hypothetical protein